MLLQHGLPYIPVGRHFYSDSFLVGMDTDILERCAPDTSGLLTLDPLRLRRRALLAMMRRHVAVDETVLAQPARTTASAQ
jgi:hypothetical protein